MGVHESIHGCVPNIGASSQCGVRPKDFVVYDPAALFAPKLLGLALNPKSLNPKPKPLWFGC